MADKRMVVQATKNYRMFKPNKGKNRGVNLPRHRRLKELMKKYGFLKCFPIVCVRDKGGSLVVRDGQHRLAFAEELGLTVYYVITDEDFDPAEVGTGFKTWTLLEHITHYASQDNEAYMEGLEFADRHNLKPSIAFALLAGLESVRSCKDAIESGTFQIQDRAFAEIVAGVFVTLAAMAKGLARTTFMEACMAVCRVPGFDPRRLLMGAGRCREKLAAYATKEGYLDMLEEVYNYGRKQMVPLKVMATMATREQGNAKRKADDQAA